ncbi:MAG: hypothetical protein LBV20_02880 [Treponema sp.]|jgi:hypothetical protein|nr:hypothetical protein [Treponema sp.]
MILNKPVWLLIMFALLGGGLLFSETVSVMIVETGVSEESPMIESSGLWESGLMDTFFENGHIVSNASMLRLNAEQANPFPSDQLINVDEAREGGSAYYVLAILNYSDENESDAVPSSISLRLVQLHLNKVLYETSINGAKIEAFDEMELAKQVAETMIPYLKK